MDNRRNAVIYVRCSTDEHRQEIGGGPQRNASGFPILRLRQVCAILISDGGEPMSRAVDSAGPRIPKRFWQDEKWAFDHYPELLKRYEDRWVAVVNRRVVAASKSSVKAEEQAKAKTGRQSPIAVVFVESGRHVY